MVYGYNEHTHVNTFDCKEVVQVIKYSSIPEAQHHINYVYRELTLDIADADLFIYPEVKVYEYIIVYQIPRQVNSDYVTSYHKYVLQRDGSLTTQTKSCNAKTYTSVEEAHRAARALGILCNAYSVEPICTEF